MADLPYTCHFNRIFFTGKNVRSTPLGIWSKSRVAHTRTVAGHGKRMFFFV